MTFNPGLSLGQAIDNPTLTDIFKCGPQQGMRKSNSTNTLVLISNHTKSLYEDMWRGDLFHYTGMGTLGDQDLSYMQNKTLAQSLSNGVDVFLFEVFTIKEYTYIGQVDLAGEPYQEKQVDDKGLIRMVWMFPLRVREGQASVPVPEAVLIKQQARRERSVNKFSDEALRARSHLAQGAPGERVSLSINYQRDPNVVIWVKRVAKGRCQLCDEPAPFLDKEGEPYLECHHIKWLSEGGADSVENTVALCPNCHRKVHILNLTEDVIKLKQSISSRER